MNVAGFIDLQINGYAGIDFSDPDLTVDHVLEAAEILAGKGTAGFLATIVTNPLEVIERSVETIAKAINKQGRAGHILGIHLEGPFLSPEYGYRGAHPVEWICPPNLEWFQRLQNMAEGHLRLVTIAPEYEEAVAFIKAVAPEVLVAAGHSPCPFRDMQKAVGAGLSLATHIGNGCRQAVDRHDNPVVNILACPQITTTFIPDGFHLPEAFLRMLLACRPVEKLIAISDAVTYAGMEPGHYSYRGVDIVLREDGRLQLAGDPDMMAGSSSTMLQCMNRLAALGVLSEEELYRVGYFNPLRVLGLGGRELCGTRRIVYDARCNRFEMDG